MAAVTSLKRMSGLEINVVLHEMQKSAMGLRVANLYSINKRTYLIKLVGSSRKLFLIFESGVRVHLTDYERDVESTPNGLAAKMRRYLRGKRLMAVEQLGLDRVVRLQFGIDDTAFNIFIELYGTGNVVFTNHKYEILALLRQQSYGQSLLGHSPDENKDQASGVLLHSRYAWDPTHSLPQTVDSEFVTALFSAKHQRVLLEMEQENTPQPAPAASSRPAKVQRKKKKTVPTVKEVLYQSIFGPQLSLHGCSKLGINVNQSYMTALEDPVYVQQLVSALNLSLQCYKEIIDRQIGYLLCRHSPDNHVSYTFDFTPGNLYQTTVDPNVQVLPIKVPLIQQQISTSTSQSISNEDGSLQQPSDDAHASEAALTTPSDPIDPLHLQYIREPFIDPMSKGKQGSLVTTYHMPADGWPSFDWQLINTTTATPHGDIKEVWFYCDSFSSCVDAYYGSKEVEREQLRVIREKENAASKIEKAKHDHHAKLEVLGDQIHELTLKAQLIEANSDFVDNSITAVVDQINKGRDWQIIKEVIAKQKQMLNPIAIMITKLKLVDHQMTVELTWDLDHIRQYINKAIIERNNQQQLVLQHQQMIQSRLNQANTPAGTSSTSQPGEEEDEDHEDSSEQDEDDSTHEQQNGSTSAGENDKTADGDNDDQDNDEDNNNDDNDDDDDGDMIIVDDMEDETLQEAVDSQDDAKEQQLQDNLPGSVNNPVRVVIDLSKTAFANAQAYYSEAKELSRKMTVTETLGLQSVKTIEKRALREISNVKESTSRIRRKVMWFEKFHWFITTEGFLVIAGRDAAQNELLVKRYLSSNDLYFHADLHGASSVVLKNFKNLEQVPQLSISQAAAFTVCHSAAWKNKATNIRAYWVHSHQVSKTPPTGMYLPQGSFMIRGTKNYVETQPLVMGVGLLFRCGDLETIERHRGERRIRESQQAEDNRYIEEKRKAEAAQKLKDEEEIRIEQEQREREMRKLQQIEQMHNEQQRLLEEKYYGKATDAGSSSATQDSDGTSTEIGQPSNDGQQNKAADSADKKAVATSDAPKKRVLSRKDRYDMKKLGLSVEKYWAWKDEQEEKARLEAEEAERIRKQQEEETERLRQEEEDRERQAKEQEKAALQDDDDSEDDDDDDDEDEEIDFDNIDDEDDDDDGDDDVDISSEDHQSSAPDSSQQTDTAAGSAPVRHKNTKRGKKRAQQYNLQDEEDLARIEQLYGIKRSQSKESQDDEKDASTTSNPKDPKEYYRQRQQEREEKFRQREALLSDQYKGVIPEGTLHEIAADNEIDDDDDDQEKRLQDKEQMDGTEYLLTQLTSKPFPEDNLTHAIPMVGPYAAFSDFTFRVKLMPGGGKKGATIKDATATFLRTANDLLRGETIANFKELPSLIKQINDSSFSLAMISGAKVSAAGLSQIHRQLKQQKKQAAKQRDAKKQ